MRILLVDDNDVDRLIADRALRAAYPEAEVATRRDARGLAAQLRDSVYDCLLLDYRMPGFDGLDSLREIEAAALPRLPAIIMLTGMGDEGVAVEAMKLGATDYLRKEDISAELLQRTIRGAVERTALKQQLAEYQQLMERMALSDALTGLGNRVSFDQRLNQLVARAERGGQQFALLLIDLDKFKLINDTHGHPAGDAVLKEIALRMRAVLRLSDGAYRLGGDEFAVLLEDGFVEVVAQRLLVSMKEPVDFGHIALACGGSIGIACYPNNAKSPRELYAAADQAMYEAKRAGGGLGYAPLISGAGPG